MKFLTRLFDENYEIGRRHLNIFFAYKDDIKAILCVLGRQLSNLECI